MAVVRRGCAGRLGAFGFMLAIASASVRPAVAQVKQADLVQTPLPQPVGLSEANLVSQSYGWNADSQIFRDPAGNLLNPQLRYGDYYAPPNYPQFVTGDAITLSGLFKWRKEAIDPVQDAQLGPGYFSAQCGLTVEVVLKGGNCPLSLGWYNVSDPSSKTPPSAAQIYPFVDDPGTSLNCTEQDGVTPLSGGFCPLAWDNVGPLNLSGKRWVPKQFSTGNLSTDPRYTGGFVALALIGTTSSSSKCTQTKFSMYEHNQRNGSGVPWVTALIYPSKVHPGSVYLAFEDLPMPGTSWTASGADGDFNDFVYYVSGCPSGAGGSGGSGTSAGGTSAGGTGAGGTGAGGTSAGGAATAGSMPVQGGQGGEAGEGTVGAAGIDGVASGAAGAEAIEMAGDANAAGGASSTAGAAASGGVTPPGATDTKSSSCAYAVSGERAAERGLPLLNLVLSAAFLHRRRRARAR